MKTIRLHAPNDLRLHEESKPKAGRGESLVHVTAVGICGSDLHWFSEAGIGDAKLKPPSYSGTSSSAQSTLAHEKDNGWQSTRLFLVKNASSVYKAILTFAPICASLVMDKKMALCVNILPGLTNVYFRCRIPFRTRTGSCLNRSAWPSMQSTWVN